MPKNQAAPRSVEAEERHGSNSAASEAEQSELREAAGATSSRRRQHFGVRTVCEAGCARDGRRDNYPMPKSVTTPEMFYEVMAGAALDAIDFRALLGHLERANQQLQITQEDSRLAETVREDARLSNG